MQKHPLAGCFSTVFSILDCLLEDDTTCEDLMGDQKPLVWKIWQRGRNDGEMKRDFKDTIYWYMECGKYGRCKYISNRLFRRVN